MLFQLIDIVFFDIRKIIVIVNNRLTKELLRFFIDANNCSFVVRHRRNKLSELREIFGLIDNQDIQYSSFIISQQSIEVFRCILNLGHRCLCRLTLRTG